ncbi:hypothetical protein GCM10010168_37870 [Actinoplanes ianthinogenes]|uniref:Uncharacterized protein n=1 Tax=Actinoplanes ianthinogenes TaxID=122358 RepID=A0ABM7M4Y9_9ACTN|nr:hypothetical protein [Actinoplanes ianthinogenes]BCJ46691.1 hypothetical protein Aiant_73480 [Actinoplanes ianthinogenes]GGR16319.1 hypothetical protein GCM10010168_37870 [Actinoplanes ianthinogenes]
MAVAAAAGGAFAALDSRPTARNPQPRHGPAEFMIPREGPSAGFPMPTARTRHLTAIPVVHSAD